MATGSHIWFSKEHGDGDDRHVDTYRQASDSPDTEKIDHTPTSSSPGYFDQAVDIPVSTDEEK